jgi:hypothetical protein
MTYAHLTKLVQRGAGSQAQFNGSRATGSSANTCSDWAGITFTIGLDQSRSGCPVWIKHEVEKLLPSPSASAEFNTLVSDNRFDPIARTLVLAG